MNTIEKVKQWFIDRDLENGGRLDKQSLKLSEEFGELCAGYLKKNEKLTKDSIGDCAVVIVGLALLIKEDVHKIFEKSENDRDLMTCFSHLSRNISDFQIYKAVIKWHESYASFIYIFVDELQKRVAGWSPLYLAYFHFEVIGNKFETPEFLEVKE